MNNLQAFVKDEKNIRKLLGAMIDVRSIGNGECGNCPCFSFCRSHPGFSDDCDDIFVAWALSENTNGKK